MCFNYFSHLGLHFFFIEIRNNSYKFKRKKSGNASAVKDCPLRGARIPIICGTQTGREAVLFELSLATNYNRNFLFSLSLFFFLMARSNLSLESGHEEKKKEEKMKFLSLTILWASSKFLRL